MLFALKLRKGAAYSAGLFLSCCLISSSSLGQSIDINSPTPVRTNEIVGTIAARDLGDARLTDHFYAFAGTLGDVLITIKSNNLNGDVDVFTAGSLRPLLKFTLYAESSLPVTKSIFLRKREELILRVEARSPNDDEGIYHVRLGGSFEPIAGQDLLAAVEKPAEDSTPSLTSGSKGRRVSSVGARIAEPPPPPEEVAVGLPASIPQPTPVDSPEPIATPERSAETESARPPPRTARGARGRVPAGRRRPASEPSRKGETVAGTDNARVAEIPESNARPAPANRRAGRRGTTSDAATTAPEPEPEPGPRLIIEMQDGTRVERFMNTIRRVTVENNQIVVVGREGKIERIRMAEVIRMAIEP